RDRCRVLAKTAALRPICGPSHRDFGHHRCLHSAERSDGIVEERQSRRADLERVRGEVQSLEHITALHLRGAVSARSECRRDALEVGEVECRVGAIASLWLIEADVPRFVPEVAGANKLERIRGQAIDARTYPIDRVYDDEVIDQ